MNEDEDFSSLPFHAYFVDKRCREFQQVLRTIPEYEELVVIRQMWGDDWKLQPYIILDDDKKHLMILEPEILDTLSESELLSYIDVEMKRIEHHEGHFWLLVALIVLTPTMIFNSIMTMLYLPNLDFARAVGVMLALNVLTLILGIIYYQRRNSSISMKRHIDLKAARETSTFLSALRKLSSLPDLVENPDSEKRLRNIERVLSGSDS